MRLPALSLLISLLLACSGGSSNTPTADPGDNNNGSEAKPDKEALCQAALERTEEINDAAWEKLVEAGPPQTLEEMGAAACQIYCGRATECAIEEACEKQTAAEIAEYDFEKTGGENTRQCLDKCNSSRRTKEQIQIIGNCSQADTDCATFRNCTADAEQ